MTSTQENERQLGKYEGKLNRLEHERARAVADIEHGGREVKRLEVLLELGEATGAELVNTREQVTEAGRRLEGVLAGLETARRARDELEGRLTDARRADERAAKRAALVEYRDAATELLGLLGQARAQRARMEAAGPGFWREGFIGLGKASRAAVESWPGRLEQDVRLVGERLEAFDESGD